MAESSAATSELISELDNGVLTLTLNRPQRLNAWTTSLGEELFSQLEWADSNPAVRAIVITGAGKGFCAGADMGDLSTISTDIAAADATWPLDKSELYPLAIRKPIIAAVNGACAGLGLVVALTCDIRFAAQGAKFTTSFSRRGLVAEHGVSGLLKRTVGHSRALDLLLSSRVVLADEALAMGLVNFVTEPDQLLHSANAYARDLVDNCSPRAMSAIKHQMNHDDLDMNEMLSFASKMTEASMQWPDFSEGVASFMEKRPPRFPALDEAKQ